MRLYSGMKYLNENTAHNFKTKSFWIIGEVEMPRRPLGRSPISWSYNTLRRENLALRDPSTGALPRPPPRATNRVRRQSAHHETTIWGRRSSRYFRGEVRY